MNINNTLLSIQKVRGKQKIVKLQEEYDNELLKKILLYTYDPYKIFHIRSKSIPSITRNTTQSNRWESFFDILDRCDAGELSGNEAIETIVKLFSSVPAETEEWMRKILDRHLNIGATTKTINKIFDGLIPVFEVQLSQSYRNKYGKVSSSGKFIDEQEYIAIEPKLDGFRCVAIVRDGICTLYSRNGKDISENFSKTIVKELQDYLGKKEYVFDGELMGKDFKNTAQMIHRKNIQADIDDFQYHVFDFMPLEDWLNHETDWTCQQAREKLEELNLEYYCPHVQLVERHIVPPTEREKYHKLYVEQGYEGVMLKSLHTNYQFKRHKNVVKYKEFFDFDLKVVGFEEGEGKYANQLGALIVLHHNVRVKVGSGFNEEERKEIWDNRDQYRNKIVEVRCQGITEDHSLRFPTFRSWRPDKDK